MLLNLLALLVQKYAVQTLTPEELQVSVEDLPKMDTFGSCDTYVKIRIGNAVLQTQIVELLLHEALSY